MGSNGGAVGVVGDAGVEAAFVVGDEVAVDAFAGGIDVVIDGAEVGVGKVFEERYGCFLVAAEEVAAIAIAPPECKLSDTLCSGSLEATRANILSCLDDSMIKKFYCPKLYHAAPKGKTSFNECLRWAGWKAIPRTVLAWCRRWRRSGRCG